MATALSLATESLSDPALSLPDALRRLLVVARRRRSEQLTTWIKNELDGYGRQDLLPEYRPSAQMPVRLKSHLMMREVATQTFSWVEIPEELRVDPQLLGMREPVAEMISLAGGGNDPTLDLPLAWVARYRALAEQGKAAHYEMSELASASVVFPKTHLQGVLDRIRTAALDLALELEEVSLDVGTNEGPKVSDEPRLAHTVNLFSTHVYGDHSNVTSGQGGTAVQVITGDVASLLEAARQYLDER